MPLGILVDGKQTVSEQQLLCFNTVINPPQLHSSPTPSTLELLTFNRMRLL